MSLGGLDALFNPSKRHMEEEKLRLQSTREEAGDASGGRRIDLDSGKVRISKAVKPATAEAASEAATEAGESAPPSEDAAAVAIEDEPDESVPEEERPAHEPEEAPGT